MAEFNDFKTDVLDPKVYDENVKNALKKLTEEPKGFYYCGRFTFGDGAVGALLVIDKQLKQSLIAEIKKVNPGKNALGTCAKVNGKFVFRVEKGAVKEENFKGKLKALLAGKIKVLQMNAEPETTQEEERLGKEAQRKGDKELKIDARMEKHMDRQAAVIKDSLQEVKAALDDVSARRKQTEKEVKELAALLKKKEQTKPADGADPGQAKALEDAKAQLVKLMKESDELWNERSARVEEFTKLKKFKDAYDSGGWKALAEKMGYEESAKKWVAMAEEAKKITGKAKLYIGRIGNTEKLLDVEGKKLRVLDAAPWNKAVNDAFMLGGVNLEAQFKMKSKLAPGTIELLKKKPTGRQFKEALTPVGEETPLDPGLYNPKRKEPSVTVTEIAQLLDEGYWYHDGKRSFYPKTVTPEKVAAAK